MSWPCLKRPPRHAGHSDRVLLYAGTGSSHFLTKRAGIKWLPACSTPRPRFLLYAGYMPNHLLTAGLAASGLWGLAGHWWLHSLVYTSCAPTQIPIGLASNGLGGEQGTLSAFSAIRQLYAEPFSDRWVGTLTAFSARVRLHAGPHLGHKVGLTWLAL